MPKILKYQTQAFDLPHSLYDNSNSLNLILPTVKFMNENLNESSKDLMIKNKPFKSMFSNTELLNNGIIPKSVGNLQLPTSATKSGASSGNINVDAKKGPTALGQVGLDVLGALPQLTDAGLQAFGVKRAETASAGEEFGMGLMDTASSALMKSGNPWAMGAGALLTGASTLNKYAGTTSQKQRTIGLDTGGYNFNLNPTAGKKQTLLGTWAGKTKKADKLTNYYDKQNVLAGLAAYQNKQSNLAAQNSFSDISSKTQQQLFGGLNTNVLSAKRGAKINPAQLRNLKNKVAIKVDSTKEINLPKFAEGGQLNVIPDGALHARKHTLPEEIAEKVTDKGIPVITFDEGGEITQHAEIEKDEIIFNKEVTTKLEDLFKKFNDAESEDEKNKLAIEAGKILTYEILENTDDRTGLLETIE